MLLSLIKDAVTESRYSTAKKQIIRTLVETLGKDKAERIIESYQITPADYEKWLEVVIGYARDEGINIKTKSAFQDVAFAVLENDPVPVDMEMQEAIVNTLWANFKAKQQHSKVEKVARAREEEEQLKYALSRMSGKNEEEEESAFAQAYQRAFQDEEYQLDPEEFSTDERDEDLGDRDRMWRDRFRSGDENWWEEQDADQNDLPFDDDEYDDEYGDEDADIMRRAGQMRHSRDLEDFDPASQEGMGRDEQIINRGRQQQQAGDLEDFDQVRRSKPRAFYASENEEHSTNYSSPFSKGQLVTCKKDGASYKVEIADGPGSQVGILVNGRIKMVPSKDLEVPHAKEEEESTSNQPTNRVSFLHDVLTGENSREHLLALQKKVENEAANAWTTHHAKMPKNPHPKGSIAYKAWEKGIASAAKEVWAPKPVVVDPKFKAKSKSVKKK